MKKIEIKHLILFCLFCIHTMYGNTQTTTKHKLQMGIVISSGLNFNKMDTKIAKASIPNKAFKRSPVASRTSPIAPRTNIPSQSVLEENKDSIKRTTL